MSFGILELAAKSSHSQALSSSCSPGFQPCPIAIFSVLDHKPVFTGPIFQESDPVYEGVKVPVAFYKVVAVVDDAKGQLGVTAFEMDQSNVMSPQPGAPMPEAPFDPGRFSVDQITLSELEERSGLDFGRLKDFDVLAAQPVPTSLLKGARLCLPLTRVRESCCGLPNPTLPRYLVESHDQSPTRNKSSHCRNSPLKPMLPATRKVEMTHRLICFPPCRDDCPVVRTS